MLGYGQSDSPEELVNYTYQSITNDISSLLTQSVGVESAIFLGHDWGSIFMWHLAVKYPQIIDGLISIAIPIFEPADINYKPKEHEVPDVQYQVSIANLNTTKYDNNIKDFLSAFLQEDYKCLKMMTAATPEVDIVEFNLALPCNQKLAIDDNV
ncbi:hypothetical protein DSO57_1013353 [Entomophthora muscae]|uniref:Uncharacterized protein n=1 Tax=Entomophthora muscae TaxID=34485 RepID=A0ACC2URW1_9FUNG|nr:hypothetical protein DSO57_1013353 [Entomophthora muscae]